MAPKSGWREEVETRPEHGQTPVWLEQRELSLSADLKCQSLLQRHSGIVEIFGVGWQHGSHAFQKGRAGEP